MLQSLLCIALDYLERIDSNWGIDWPLMPFFRDPTCLIHAHVGSTPVRAAKGGATAWDSWDTYMTKRTSVSQPSAEEQKLFA